MNSKIQEILQNQAKKNAKDIEVKVVPISKPFALSANSPAICIDDLSYFYTFDGRSLFFEKTQTRPFISLPYETKMAFLLRHTNDALYAVFLSSKNKLEIVKYDEIGTGNKQVITRNVEQVVKTKNRIFYVFKKEEIYFINEVIYESNKWIGKHVLPFIKAATIELFPSNGTILYIADGQVYNLLGQDLGVRGTFAYSYEDMVIVAGPGQSLKKSADKKNNLIGEGEGQQAGGLRPACMGFEISLYTMDMLLINTFIIETQFECAIKCIENIIVVQNESKLHILKIDSNQIKLVDVRKQRNITYQFDVAIDQGVLNVFVLTDPAVVAGQESYGPLVADPLLGYDALKESLLNGDDVRASADLFSDRDDGRDGPLRIRPEAVEGDANAEDSNDLLDIENNEDMDPFVDGPGAGSQTVLGEMEAEHDAQVHGSDVLEGEGQQVAGTNTSKNYLFDAVKQSLNAKKGQHTSPTKEGGKASHMKEGLPLHHASTQKHQALSVVSESQGSTQKVVDRFEKYAKDHSFANGSSIQARNSPASCAMPNPEGIKEIGEKAVCGAGDTPRLDASQATSARVREKQAGAGPCPPNSRNNAQKNISSDGLTGEIQSIICSSLESVVVKNEAFIKNLILKAIVPAVEATINEMRVQVITELRKMDIGTKVDPFYGKGASFKKLINSGKVGVAIQELVKLKGPEFEGILNTIHPGAIEGVDSNVLSVFIERLFGSMKRQFKDHHAKLLYDALLDIEISELSIDNLQVLSVALRYSKEMGALDGPNYIDLNFLIDIICKKMKRRVNSLG